MSTMIECTNINPWVLTSAKHPVKVIAGSMNIYVRHLHPDGSAGYLTFSVAASEGMVLFPVLFDKQADFSVIAIGNADTRLLELPCERDQWDTLAKAESKGLAIWLDSILVAAETDAMQTSQYVPIRADSTCSVNTGTHVTALRQPAWVRAGDVTSLSSISSPQNLDVIPVTGRFPAVSQVDGTLQCYSTEVALRQFNSVPIIQTVHDLCIVS